MTYSDQSLPYSLMGMLGPSSLSEEELMKLRHQAWWEQGLLIVHPWNVRLTPDESQALTRIAERLYGGKKL